MPTKEIGRTSSSCGRWSRDFALRVTVVACMTAAAVVFAVVTHSTLSQYEMDKANSSFESTSSYVLGALQDDFAAKENGVLSMVKNMAYLQPNLTQWPNVVMPGFYDSNVALKRVASFSEIMFVPLVLPEKLSSFEPFLRDFMINEANIPVDAYNVDETYHGVISLNGNNQFVHDTTGVAETFHSPYKLFTPIAQFFYSKYFGASNFAFNLHSLKGFGVVIDDIIECSHHINYTAAGSCVNTGAITKLPVGVPDSEVESVHSIILQPIFLEQNTSQLVGFMGGGFDWLDLMNPLFLTAKSGIDVVIENGNTMSTFTSKEGGGLVFRGIGDWHNFNHNRHEVSAPLFGGSNTTSRDSAYYIRMYPTDAFVSNYTTSTPTIVSTVVAVFIFLCIVAFLAYDLLMRKASEANAAVLETKRRFVRFISHEIRTPLNAVHLGLEALTSEVGKIIDHMTDPTHLASSLELLDTLRSWLELSSEMMGNSESAVDVLNDLLNYDKIEMGTLRLEFSSVAIWSVVQSVTVSFLTPAKQKNIHFTLDTDLAAKDDDLTERPQDMFVVVGDSGRLAQVMRNLISNAIKFTPENGHISIQVANREGGLPNPALVVPAESEELLQQPRAGSVRISVTDSGAGLSEDQLAKICSEGVQFNANELQAGKGSGLGLFISKGIVEQHGGTLTVTSPGIGQGTTFTMELPLFHRKRKHAPHSFSTRQVTPDNSICEKSGQTGSVARADSNASLLHEGNGASLTGTRPSLSTLPKRILVVDDASSNRKMLIRILTSNGYVCEQAEDGQQGIERYVAALQAGVRFDAIIMDFEMPVMNGPTATKKLREMGCAVPVLGVTGNLLPEDIKYFKEHGADQVFGKPLNLTRFEEFMCHHDVGRPSGVSVGSSHSQTELQGFPPRDSKCLPGACALTLSSDSVDLGGVNLV